MAAGARRARGRSRHLRGAAAPGQALGPRSPRRPSRVLGPRWLCSTTASTWSTPASRRRRAPCSAAASGSTDPGDEPGTPRHGRRADRTGWVHSSCRHRRPSPATVRQCSSVRLFIDRALLRRPDLALGDDETGGDRVDLPAGRRDPVRHRAGQRRPGQRARPWPRSRRRSVTTSALLSGSATVDVGAREPTLRAMIERSDNLLSEHERMLLRRLSVFAAGFSLERGRDRCARRRHGGRFDIFDAARHPGRQVVARDGTGRRVGSGFSK